MAVGYGELLHCLLTLAMALLSLHLNTKWHVGRVGRWLLNPLRSGLATNRALVRAVTWISLSTGQSHFNRSL